MLLFLFGGGDDPDCLRACDANRDRGVDVSDAPVAIGIKTVFFQALEKILVPLVAGGIQRLHLGDDFFVAFILLGHFFLEPFFHFVGELMLDAGVEKRHWTLRSTNDDHKPRKLIALPQATMAAPATACA